jgi:hypothetical protein
MRMHEAIIPSWLESRWKFALPHKLEGVLVRRRPTFTKIGGQLDLLEKYLAHSATVTQARN